MHHNWMKIGRVVSEMRADRQTGRQTNRHRPTHHNTSPLSPSRLSLNFSGSFSARMSRGCYEVNWSRGIPALLIDGVVSSGTYEVRRVDGRYYSNIVLRTNQYTITVTRLSSPWLRPITAHSLQMICDKMKRDE